MAILLRVKWVEKSDQPEPQHRIRQIGGNSRQFQWKHSQAQAVEFIERHQFEYYIEKSPSPVRLAVARARDGRKYLTAKAEAELSQLLLDLPQSPPPASKTV
jgi:hypothetical protein